MKISEFDGYVVLRDERGSLKKFANFLERKIPAQFSDRNVVVDMTDIADLQLEQLLYFMTVSNNHRSGKNSFIIVNQTMDPDEIPHEIIVVPTLIEARDIIEMEEIERNLGF